jgi:ATP-dependent Clp protease protease subunit
MNIIPTVIEKTQGAGSMVSYDLLSRLMQDRILFVGGNHGAISLDDANILISQLLYLESIDPGKLIQMYVNSPGGEVSAGLAILDTMRHITSPIQTICMGMAMSFGAVLLSAGAKGKRFALPNARIMIHQPLISGGGISGQATDIEIEAKEMSFYKKRLTEILAKNCNQKYEKVLKDCERNFYMSAEEAKEYGLVDQVIYPAEDGGSNSKGYFDDGK